MPAIDLAAARLVAEDAARAVAPALRAGFGAAPIAAVKSNFALDVVTDLDRQTEKQLAELLANFNPAIPFRGEEYGGDTEAGTTWLVDPIDGTGHFIRGIPWCTTMISLIVDGEVAMSVIHRFVQDELYSAARGAGATRNGEPISVSDRSLAESYLGLEMDTRTSPANAELYRRLQGTAGLVDFFACGFPMTLVAEGRLDGRITYQGFGKDWDYAPGALLVSEAGGVVANVGLSTYDYRNHDFLAANPRVFAELVEQVVEFRRTRRTA